MGHYLKEGNSDYATVNPQNHHLVFTSEQLASSLKATTLSIPVLCGSLIMDAERLHSNIPSQLRDDPVSTEHLDNQSDPKFVKIFQVTPLSNLNIYSALFSFQSSLIMDSSSCVWG